ncbi:hypothetical protein DVH24_031342 [Malus domestica]|uniref:Uncharacterized protein n=1 Tax=Malus domestica TaxID=3750 RepID=A0A498HD80_MALDO|nr:hypothetical protein DVH24_031342 [Malus domestica]
MASNQNQNLSHKAGELTGQAQVKKDELLNQASGAAQSAQNKASNLSQSAQNKASDASRSAQNKASDESPTDIKDQATHLLQQACNATTSCHLLIYLNFYL